MRTESGIDQARQLLGGRWTVVVGLVVASAVFGLTQALILAIVAEAAGALVDHAHLVHIAVGPVRLAEPVGTLLYLGIGVCAVALLLQIPLSILPARMSSEVQAQMQRDLFAAYTRASWAEQASDREGHLQELITNQALQAAWITASATQLVTAGLTLAVLMASAILLNPEAAGLVFAAGIIVFAVLRPVHHLVSKFASAQSLAQMELASGIGQASRLAEETHVFGVADAQRRRFEHLVDSVRRMYFRAQAVAKFSQGAYQGLIYLLAVAGLIAISASHAGSVASLGAVVLLLVRAGSYSLTVQGSYQGIRAALPFVARVRETEHRYQRSARVGGQLPLSEIRSLGFEEVSFGYRPRRRVLTDVSFTVRQGEAIGVVGPSGVGKTTLVQLLLQLRAPDTGRYVVNDEVASNYLRTDWERCVSYVPQEPRLLHATVADNIRYFRPLTDAAVHRAARLARIDDDILEWSQGYETLIGPRADAVSGGQQQRLCIARALATQPAVLVLDEPTSALDPRSEGLLQESLHDLRGSVTLFVIAHRMSTLTICDRVIVLVGGQVESFDTPDELRRSSSYYRAATDIRDRGTETRPHLQSH